MSDSIEKRFTGTYRSKDGRRLTFHVDAASWRDAELAIEQIGATGEILGELIEEGECEFTEVGHA